MTSLVTHMVTRSDADVIGALQLSPALNNTWVALCQAAPPLTNSILRLLHLRNRLKRRALETQTLTYLGYKPRFSVPSCMVIVFLIAPLTSAGAERPGFAASARRRSARNGMLHAGRRREPGTTAGVIGPATVAVRRSEGRCEGVCVRRGTTKSCDSGVITDVVAVEKAVCVVCDCIMRYVTERADGARSSVAGCERTAALRTP